ncbi:MAG: DNA-3-methyladenine glycosylase [Nitrososphaerales archaeon]
MKGLRLPEGTCKPLRPSFYKRPAPMVAWDLLGKILVHNGPDGPRGGIITETEAYLGKRDRACHASHGLTNRNRIFYEAEAGTAYVFQCHGGKFLFNVLTNDYEPLECVLIRAIEPTIGVERMQGNHHKEACHLTNGPAKMSKALGITKSINGSLVTDGPVLILGSRKNGYSKDSSPRIGISRDKEYPLRYYIAGNRFVSRHPGPKPNAIR